MSTICSVLGRDWKDSYHAAGKGFQAIRRFYAQSVDWERLNGAAWYRREAERIVRLAAGRLTLERASAIFAALSPRVRIEKNRNDYVHVLCDAGILSSRQRPETVTAAYSDNIEKALSLVDCATKDIAPTLAPCGPSGAPKIWNFWRALNGDRTAVCVDTWIVRAWLDTLDAPNIQPTWCQYRAIVRDILRVSKSVGADPRAVQATVWVHVRRVAKHELPLAFETAQR